MWRQAMRLPSSNSVTSFVTRYGPPIRMSIPNRAPSERRSGLPPREPLTVPDPSSTGCIAGSASRSKICWAGAWITRETESTLPATTTFLVRLRLDEDSHGSVVGELHLHVRAEGSPRGGHAQLVQT